MTIGNVYSPPSNEFQHIGTPDQASPEGGPTALTPEQTIGLQFAPIAAADIATTTGTEGESRQISDGADEGARIIWTSTTANPTPSWCWWLWPQSVYEGA